jgi:hypothetical protein
MMLGQSKCNPPYYPTNLRGRLNVSPVALRRERVLSALSAIATSNSDSTNPYLGGTRANTTTQASMLGYRASGPAYGRARARTSTTASRICAESRVSATGEGLFEGRCRAGVRLAAPAFERLTHSLAPHPYLCLIRSSQWRRQAQGEAPGRGRARLQRARRQRLLAAPREARAAWLHRLPPLHCSCSRCAGSMAQRAGLSRAVSWPRAMPHRPPPPFWPPRHPHQAPTLLRAAPAGGGGGAGPAAPAAPAAEELGPLMQKLQAESGALASQVAEYKAQVRRAGGKGGGGGWGRGGAGKASPSRGCREGPCGGAPAATAHGCGRAACGWRRRGDPRAPSRQPPPARARAWRRAPPRRRSPR